MVEWQDGTLVSPAKVNEDGTITPAVYEGATPLSKYLLNKMQDDLLAETKKLEETTYKEIITAEKSIITLPFYYKVGANMLRVVHNGQELEEATAFAGHDGYWLPIAAENEIAPEGTWTNKIQCNEGWTWLPRCDL